MDFARQPKSISLIEKRGSIHSIDALLFENLLRSCSSNLEKIEINCQENIFWIETFAQFTCPKLTDLSIHTTFGGEIMAKNQNLKRVRLWVSDRCLRLTNDCVVCENLRTLIIQYANEATIRSLTGRFPNLIEFHIAFLLEFPIPKNVLNNFFASCPKLMYFRTVADVATTFRYSQLNHFWRLNSMRELNLGSGCHSIPFIDQDVQKISTCFPRLTILALSDMILKDVGFVALASLKNLVTIRVGWRHPNEIEGDFDRGVRRLIECKNLETLYMNVSITPTTLIDLIRHCHRLKDLIIRRLISIDTIEQAVTIVKSFGQFKNKKMKIHFYSKSEIWKSEIIKTNLLLLHLDGISIQIEN